MCWELGTNLDRVGKEGLHELGPEQLGASHWKSIADSGTVKGLDTRMSLDYKRNKNKDQDQPGRRI